MNRLYKITTTDGLTYTQYIEDQTDFGKAMLRRAGGDSAAAAIEAWHDVSDPLNTKERPVVTAVLHRDYSN